MARESFAIGTVRVRAGTSRALELPITRLVTGAEISLPVRIIHGREDGPTVWVDAAIHGDEVVGVEVIRQVLADLDPKTFRGTLIAVPIVNVLGFMTGDRYLPDRRDLNRSFPGSARGSLASRIAHLFMEEVVAKSEVGIDLHTGSDRRSNLPQVRADLDDPRTRALAEAFAAPVMLHAKIRDGSLRHAARERGATVLLYEGGENLRFDDYAIDAGVAGVRRVLAVLGHDRPLSRPRPRAERRVPRQRLGPRPAYRHPRPRRPARPAGDRRRAARRARRLLRPHAAAGPRQPHRHRHRPHRGTAGQLRRRARPHRDLRRPQHRPAD